MDTDSYTVYVETDDIYKDIADDVGIRFDTLNYELDRPLLKGKNKKVSGLMKDKLGGKTMTKLIGLREKTYSYLIDESSEDENAKDTKKGAIKRKLEFENCKKYSGATQLDNKINYLKKRN